MGNEALKSSRSAGASIFRRHSQRRRSTGSNGGGGGGAYVDADEANTVAEFTAPKPARRMDKIRRSLSFRRKKKSKSGGGGGGGGGSRATDTTTNRMKAITEQPSVSTGQPTIGSDPASNSSNTAAVAATASANNNSNNNNSKNSTTASVTSGAAAATATGAPSRPALWVDDERRVRAGSCSFQVKYLGYQEVSDSRGMHICELALERLLAVSKSFFIFFCFSNFTSTFSHIRAAI